MKAVEKTAQPGFRILRRVTVPTLTLTVGEEAYMKFLTPFELAPYRAGNVDDKPPMVARVIAFTVVGESLGEHTMVGGSVLISILNERYENDAYVDKTFAVTKMTRKPTKEGIRPRASGKQDYFVYLVNEVEVNGAN